MGMGQGPKGTSFLNVWLAELALGQGGIRLMLLKFRREVRMEYLTSGL